MTARPPLKILHIFSGDLWAGAEVMIFHLLNSLRNDSSVQIFALSLNEGTLAGKLRDVGVKTWVIPEARNRFSKILFTARRVFKETDIDIIHSHGYKQNLLAFGLAKLLHVRRLVTTLHGMPEPWSDGKINGTKARFLSALDYGIVNRSFTHVVSVSLDMRERLVDKHGLSAEKIKVIHNGIALLAVEDVPCGPAADIFHIGNVGRLVPVKDFDLFLEVAARIKRLDGTARFSILGEGPLKKHLMRRAQELGIEDHVKFLPACSDPFPYYRSIHLFLNTSLHEGIPLSIIEATASGLPVVAPRVGGIPEIIENGRQGILVDERTPEGFASACLELMRSHELRRKMGMSARERFVKHFTSSRMASSYLDLYKESSAS